MRAKKLATYCCFLLLLCTACSTTKYVPDGDYLLNKVSLKCDNGDIKQSEAMTYLRQTPNPKLFDFIPFNLSLYSLSGPDTTLWINRFLRKIGDAPVIYDSVATMNTVTELKKFMVNKGFHNAEISAMASFNGKKAKVDYSITAHEPYRIRNYEYAVLEKNLAAIIEADSSNSLVRAGDRFDTDVLEKERKRISDLLRNNGYYAFDESYVGFVADSTVGPRQVDVALVVHPMQTIDANGNKVNKRHQRYVIRNVNYIAVDELTDLRGDSLRKTLTVEKGEDLDYYYKTKFMRESTLANNTYIEKGKPFSQQAVDQTYAKLTALNVFKYLNIIFTEDSLAADSTGNRNLTCDIIISRSRIQNFSVEIEGINNEGDFGIAGKFNYAHGNIFHGGEKFKFSIGGSNESIIGKRSIWNINTELGLEFPNFFFPFLKEDFIRDNPAQTEVYGNFNYQIRTDLSRLIFGVGMRYRWQTPQRINHQVDLIDFNYVYIPFISDEMVQSIQNSLIRYSYEDHLIMRTGYSINYSNGHLHPNGSAYSVRGAIEVGGNLLYGISAASNAATDSTGAYLVGGIPFAQYVKVDGDFSYNMRIDERNSLVFHAGLGVGVPYLNSTILPFEKRYYGGGANSVRGWSARSLGPGSYNAGTTIDYMKQSGDISLNLNIEFRTHLVWYLELAAFIDAGNIWTLADEGTAGGQFRFDTFYEQIALGYGIGLRLNFDYFVVRLDWGLKAFDPAQVPGQHWRFTNTWNIMKDTALQFAVGYTF